MRSPLGLPLPICSWPITKRNGCKNLVKSKFPCINVMLMIFFCMFGNKKSAENFFEFLHCWHKNIKFTREKESNKLLAFLDILIKYERNIFSISLYQNETSIGFFTQFNSFPPMGYKIGLERCLIHKALKISSSYITFHNNLEKIRILLQKNMLKNCNWSCKTAKS